MAKYDQGGGCACGVKKLCDCPEATREDLLQGLCTPRLLQNGQYYCDIIKQSWKPGTRLVCAKCDKIRKRLDNHDYKPGHGTFFTNVPQHPEENLPEDDLDLDLDLNS